MANNLKDLAEDLRQQLSRHPALLNLWVATNGVGSLVDDVREQTTVDLAVATAKAGQATLGPPPATDATVDDVYLATGTVPKGPGGICGKGYRWDEITQTCVPV